MSFNNTTATKVAPTTLVHSYQTVPSAIPGISLRNGFRFRRGQEIFLERLAEALARGEENHLGVFVPGYGKTITALAAFAVAHNLGVAKRLVIFVPRGNLRDQYADPRELSKVFFNLGAPPFTFCVADSEKVFLKNLDTSIIITTYQYASGKGGHKALMRYCASAPCMFVFDEVHHLSDDGLWASKISQFDFSCSVALSGTPMRADNKTLFGVPFEVRADGEQYYRSLHEVTMRDAHAEGKILKRVKAHVVDYKLKMVHADTGQVVEMSLSQIVEVAKNKSDVDAWLARRKLRFHEVYLDTLLRPAFERFAEKRTALKQEWLASGESSRHQRNHQMLVIAMSNRHAAAILEFIRTRFGAFSSARIGQDVRADERERLLNDYREGRLDVMVQVDMIGEGTDIKPISMIVKADLVRAYSKTMQQVFRGMRHYDAFSAEANICDIYAANDSQLVETLEWITSEEQIGIKMKEEREAQEASARSAPAESMWQLTDVQGRDMRTHTLELFPEYARPIEEPKKKGEVIDDGEGYVTNVSERENALRNECASLASRLAQILRSRGQAVEVSAIHAEAKRRISKRQEELSLPELMRKRDWLKRCIDARRII
jgi:superfamily II DNA or RNA helicase